MVKIANLGSGEERNLVTDGKGNYAVGFLPPGQYRIEISQAGFKTVVREPVTVRITEWARADALLDVAQQRESVTVTSEAEILQTGTTALGRVVDSQLITELPLVTRNFTQLTALSPGSSISLPDSSALGNGSQNVYTNGAYQLSNSYLINGIDATNVMSNAATNVGNNTGVAVPSVDSIQEFKSQTSLYDASFGRNGGANISIITKSGTSEFHGNVYEFFRNEALNANHFFFNSLGRPRPVLRQNQFGGTLGGPVVKDRTFFFVSYEGARQFNGASLTTTSQLVLPPIPLDRSASSLGAVFGGQRGALGGLAIASDGSNIHPVALKLLNLKLQNGEFLIPSPQRSGAGTNYAVSVPATYRQDQFNVNLDHQIHKNNRLAGKYFFSDAPRDEEFAQSNIPGFADHTKAGNQNLSLIDTHIFGAASLNEARLGYTRFFGLNSTDTVVTSEELGMFRTNEKDMPGLPLINVTGSLRFGSTGHQSVTVTNTFVFADTYSFSLAAKGRHDLRVGTETRRMQINQDILNTVQNMTFQSFPDFLIGRSGGAIEMGGNGTTSSNIFSTSSGNGIIYRAMRQTDQSLFIADDWKIHPRLTLNMGLRWEFLGNPWDQDGRNTNFDPRLYKVPPPGGLSSAGFVQPEGTQFPIAGIPQVSRTFLDSEDWNNWAPRFGFALRPWLDRPVVLRGGYGVFYDRKNSRTIIQETGQGQPPFFRRIILTGPTNAESRLDNPFPVLPALTDFPISLNIIPGPINGTFRDALLGIGFIDAFNRTPYLQHYNLNIQYELSGNFLLEVGYAGSKGTKLYTTEVFGAPLASPQRPLNDITTNSPANASLRMPLLGTTPGIFWTNQNSATSNYNSLQSSLTKRFGGGLYFLASYTYSKTLGTVDTGGDSFVGAVNSAAQDHSDIRGTGYGPTLFDRTHRLVASYVYQLPFLDGNSIRDRILGGWQVAGIVTFQSGTPYSVFDTLGASLYAMRTGRASYAPGASLETAELSGSVNSRLNRYFNTAAFVRAPTIPAGGTTPDGFPVSAAGTIFGNTGRNILRGPGQGNFDVSVSKRVSLREKQYLELRGEFFNVFNNVNFANPASNVGAPASFGVISATTTSPRVVQLAIKFQF